MTTSLFFIYAPQDGEYLSHIENQLQVLGDNGLITVWHQGKLAAGSNWYAVTETELGKAQIVLLIVSASFLASDSCKDWLKKADALGKQIVPIIASSCLWEYDPILKGKTPLPRKDQDIKATPLNKWTPIADGYNTVVEGIAALVEEYTRPAPIHPTTSRTTDNSNNSNNSSPKNSNNMSTQNLVFENGYALLIGVGKDLPATINDATALYDLLTDPKIAAFPKEQVILLTQEQATRQGILTALQQLADMVKKGKEATDRKTFVVSKPQNTAEKTPTATVIISYAGHGDVNSRDEYYLCSYDYITKVSNQPLWGTEFTDAVNAIPSKKKLVILDCCHAGGVRSETHNSNHTKLIAALEKGGGSAILAACQDNEKAQDLQLLNKGKHGLFTQVLINALKTPTSRQDGYVRFTDIMAYFENNFSNELQLANSSAKQTPIISKLENYNLNEPFIVCSYDIVKARGGIKPPTSEPIPDLNNNTTNITGNGNNANPPKTNENNMQELKKRLRQFQAEQIQLLGNNLDNAAQVLNNIEDRGYSYDDVKLEWYRGQLDVINSGDPRSIELVKQLNSFINNLRLNKSSISQSIAGVKEVEHPNSPLSSDAVHQKEQREKGLVDERHRHFYNYVLKFPFHEQHAMLTDYFRKVTGIKANIILLHGISKEILLNDAKIPKFEIFTQHLLPGKIKKASDKIPPAIVGYTKSLLANDSYTMPWWILKQLCGENNIDDTNQKVQFFNTVKSILEQKSLVIPYVIETKSNVAIYETIKGFITDYWTPLVEEIRQESIANKDKYNNNSLLLLLLNERNWQSDDTDLSFEVLGSNITHNSMPFKLSIQICPINHDTCSIWIDDSDGFFINYDIYDCFTTNWQQPNYIPECGTIEGLLEKITSDIFGQEISFYELLKKAKIN